jgi:hypothetical protein
MTKNHGSKLPKHFSSPEASLASEMYRETRSLVSRLALRYANIVDDIPRPGNQPLPKSMLWVTPSRHRTRETCRYKVTQYTPTFQQTRAPGYTLDYTAMWNERLIDETTFHIGNHAFDTPLKRKRQADAFVALVGDTPDGQSKRQIKLGISSRGFANIDTYVIPNDQFAQPHPNPLGSRSITASRVAWDYGEWKDYTPNSFNPISGDRGISPEDVAEEAREMLRVTAAIGSCLPIVAPESRPEMETIATLANAWDTLFLMDCPPSYCSDSISLQTYESRP